MGKTALIFAGMRALPQTDIEQLADALMGKIGGPPGMVLFTHNLPVRIDPDVAREAVQLLLPYANPAVYLQTLPVPMFGYPAGTPTQVVLDYIRPHAGLTKAVAANRDDPSP